MAAGKLSVSRFGFQVVWIRAQHEDTVATLMAVGVPGNLLSDDLDSLALRMAQRLLRNDGRVDLGALRPGPLFGTDDITIDGAAFIDEVIEAVFRQPTWDALGEWSAPELVELPGFERSLAAGVALMGPLGEYRVEAQYVVTWLTAEGETPLPALQYVIIGEFELGVGVLELIIVDRDGEPRLVSWFVVPVD